MVCAHALTPTRNGHCKSGYTRQLSSLTRHLSIASVAGARPASASPTVSAGSAVLFMKSEVAVVPALPGSCRARRRPPAGRCCGRRSHFLTSRGLATWQVALRSSLAGGCSSVAVQLLCGLAAATARPCRRRILTAGIGRTRRRVRAGAERTRGVLAAVAVPPAAALTVK